MLMFGVACFSFIMGNFIEILGKYSDLNSTFDDGDNLAKFFGLLVRFNRGKMINHDLKLKIETFFDYSWNNGRNFAIDSEDDQHILSQMPKEI